MERKPDPQAAECCIFDLRWKLALGMGADADGFHPTSLPRSSNWFVKGSTMTGSINSPLQCSWWRFLLILNDSRDGQPGAHFDFLSYRFKRTGGRMKLMRLIRSKSLVYIRQRIKPLTRRTNGKSMDQIVTKLNPVLGGVHEYFHHAW
ncbi:MAG: hypothetical protein HOH33_16290 [Verrucomicrobia bacterium]|nr:hypothetical protein [Verrucomicrobiota bacterium]